jgi:hypothetical protein
MWRRQHSKNEQRLSVEEEGMEPQPVEPSQSCRVMAFLSGHDLVRLDGLSSWKYELEIAR